MTPTHPNEPQSGNQDDPDTAQNEATRDAAAAVGAHIIAANTFPRLTRGEVIAAAARVLADIRHEMALKAATATENGAQS